MSKSSSKLVNNHQDFFYFSKYLYLLLDVFDHNNKDISWTRTILVIVNQQSKQTLVAAGVFLLVVLLLAIATIIVSGILGKVQVINCWMFPWVMCLHLFGVWGLSNFKLCEKLLRIFGLLLNDGLWVKAICWDCTSVCFTTMIAEILLSLYRHKSYCSMLLL